MLEVSPGIFWVISAVVVGSSLLVVTSKNIVHSALFLVLSFVAVAGIYAVLGLDYIAAVQILIYAGAITIMLVFGIMLTKRGNMSNTNLFTKYKISGLIISIAFLVLTVYLISLTDLPVHAGEMSNPVRLIATAMLGDFVVPFEGAAVLLLVAMVGAVMIARGGNNKS